MPKNSRNRWTTEDEKRLLELHAKGKSWLRIGVALGRSTTSIATRLQVLKLKAPKTELPAAVEPSDSEHN
jgi:hypothetical protein